MQQRQSTRDFILMTAAGIPTSTKPTGQCEPLNPTAMIDADAKNGTRNQCTHRTMGSPLMDALSVADGAEAAAQPAVALVPFHPRMPEQGNCKGRHLER